MSLRFQSQLQVNALPDEQIESNFEVVMPKLSLTDDSRNIPVSAGNKSWFSSILSTLGGTFTDYTPIVEEITFTPKSFKTETRRVRTGWLNVANDIENYGDVNITFFCSAGMLIQYYLDAWRRLIFNNDGEYYNPMQVYKRNIEVYFFGPGNIGAVTPKAAHFTLKGCFPYSQDSYKLAYKDNPQRLRISTKFKVDKIVTDESVATSSIISETVTSPTGIVDKAISNLFMSSDDYSVQDTYK